MHHGSNREGDQINTSTWLSPYGNKEARPPQTCPFALAFPRWHGESLQSSFPNFFSRDVNVETTAVFEFQKSFFKKNILLELVWPRSNVSLLVKLAANIFLFCLHTDVQACAREQAGVGFHYCFREMRVSCFLSCRGPVMQLISTGWPDVCCSVVKVVVKSLRWARNEGGNARRSGGRRKESDCFILPPVGDHKPCFVSETRKKFLRVRLRLKSRDHCGGILLGPFRGKFQTEQQKCLLSLTSEVFVLTFSPHLLFPPVAAGHGAQFYLERLSKSGDTAGNTHK